MYLPGLRRNRKIRCTCQNRIKRGDVDLRKIYFNMEKSIGITIMIFAEGTILKPKSCLTLYNHHSYIPIGNAVEIIKEWQKQGANIIYCTSRRKKQADDMADLLKNHGFRGTCLVAREPRESYADLVEILQPDILIEDDCKSIGGAWQMCFTKVKPELKEKIKHIAVPECKGIDHLSVNIKQL